MKHENENEAVMVAPGDHPVRPNLHPVPLVGPRPCRPPQLLGNSAPALTAGHGRPSSFLTEEEISAEPIYCKIQPKVNI